MLNLGNNSPINKIYLGNTEVNKAYLGNTLVYDNTGGGGPTTPDQISNLYLWLDASAESYSNGATVATLNDQSSNGYNFAGTSMTYDINDANGLPAYMFGAAGSFRNGNRSLWQFLHLSSNSVYIVSRIGNTAVDNVSSFFYNNNFNRGLSGVSFFNDNRNFASQFNHLRQLTSRGVTTQPVFYTASAPLTGLNTLAVYSYRSDLSTNSNPNLIVEKDGTVLTNAAKVYPPSGALPANDLIFGYFSGTFPGVESIAEVIIYDKKLTDQENDDVIAYLQNKYGI